jgi:hypothetical protein
MGEKLGYSLLGGVHAPYLPGPLGLFGVPLVDEHAEGERAQHHLHHDACETDELAGLHRVTVAHYNL